jgi:UDP-N-acetylglucosamine 2-epimerase
MRNVTERQEAVEAGTVKLVGTDAQVIFDAAARLLTDARARQTTPDGKTAEVSGKARSTRLRPAFSHAIENTGDRFEGILVDLK